MAKKSEATEELVSERFKKLAERWFLTEPAFFSVYCTHALTPNPNMDCAMRVGRGRLEYNAEMVKGLTDIQIEEMARVEMIRILLKHPYQRKPYGASNACMLAASDMSMSADYEMKFYKLISPNDFGMEARQPYEWYCKRLMDMFKDMTLDGESNAVNNNQNNNKSNQKGKSGKNGGDGSEADGSGDGDGNASGGEDGNANGGEDGNANGGSGTSTMGKNSAAKNTNIPGDLSERAGLWEEDQYQCDKINELIERIETSRQWGSMAGNLVGLITASAKATIDYRKVLAGFRASVISQKRKLSRRHPNRRYGFEAMGSVYAFRTNILVAIDTSGSVSDASLSHFFGVISRFFKYGVESIDVLQFDYGVQGEPTTLEKARADKKYMVKGRGGTNFQAPIDYMAGCEKRYDGLIYFTDGFAPKPDINKIKGRGVKIVWVLTNRKDYEEREKWMDETGRVCYIEA